jgi:hypothetical protein
MPGIVVVLVVILIVVVIVLGVLSTAKRRKELAAWAASKGMRFDPSHDGEMDDRFSDFKCLQHGRSRYAYNVVSGRCSELSLLAFDYHYVTGSGKNQTTHYLSAVIAESPLPLKPLFIRREGFFDKVTEFFGADDIDFESAEFSRKFFVKAPDKRWAYDVIHQRMMEYLLSGPKFAVQFDSRHIVVWNDRTLKVEEFESAIAFIRGMLDRFPDYLVEQQRQIG